MEPTCRFPLEYRSPGQAEDPVLELHLRNCSDCQEQVYDLRHDAAA